MTCTTGSVNRYCTQVRQLRKEPQSQCTVEFPEVDTTRVEPLKGDSGFRMREREPNPDSNSFLKEGLEDVHHKKRCTA